MKHFVKYLAFFVLLGACSAEEALVPDTGAGYFPLKKGHYQVYAVNEIHYSGSQVETVNYELMTAVVDSFPSAGGQYTYVIHRSQRSGESDAWEVIDTWSARIGQSEAILSEGNTPFVKVKFPATEDSRWNGNAFNTLGVDEYEIREAGQRKEFNGMVFDRTITVEQEHNEDFIVYRDERAEVYALGVGLVYKKTLQFSYCTEDHCLGQEKINAGIEREMVIKEYGD